MARITLTAARVTALRTRKSAYDTRDGKLTGFGVRVLPSGRKRFFIHCQHRGERVWRVVGDANSMTVEEARRRADEMLAAIRRGEDALPHPGETPFEAVAEIVFERYQRVWNVGTLEVNRATRATRSCRASRDARSPTSTAGRFATGSPRSALLRSRLIAPCRCSPSSRGRRKRWAFVPRAPTPAGASGAIAGKGGSASCPTTRSAACPQHYLPMPNERRFKSQPSVFSS